MSGTPQVTILMPVRDAEATLDAAIASLARQTLTEFEVIAVDDGSQDRSPQILKAWSRADKRVRVVTTKRQGLVAALELGRHKVQTELLARMDADDVSHPERLRLQARHLAKNPGLLGCGSLIRMFPRSRLRAGWLRYEAWVNRLVSCQSIRAERYVESPLVHPSVTLRTRALEETGGYRKTGWPEDHDLWLRLMASGGRLDKVPRTLLFWRESPARLTHTSSRYHPERFRQMKLFHLLAGPLANRQAVVLCGAGRNGRRWARLLIEHRIRVECFIDVDPHKVGRRILGIPVRPVEHIHKPDLPFVLGSVAAAGTRPLIRQALIQAGKTEEQDFLFVQ